jgi:hypothetical protein
MQAMKFPIDMKGTYYFNLVVYLNGGNRPVFPC